MKCTTLAVMDIPDEQTMKELGTKIQAGTATKDETIIFLRAVNVLLKQLKSDIQSL